MLDVLYKHSPLFIQNMMVSLKGGLLKRSQFGSEFKALLDELIRNTEMSPSEMKRYQVTKLKEFLAHAYNHSTYYNMLFKEHGVNPNDISCVEDLREVPVLEKSALKSNRDRVRAVPLNVDIYATKTSGTTGSPFEAGYISKDINQRFAFVFRLLHMYGITAGSRSIRLSGRSIYPGAEKNNVFWRYNYFRRQLFMSSYHLKDEFMSYYVAKIRSFKPEYIDGYPSALFVLSSYILDNKIDPIASVKVFMSTGETLEEHYVDAIKAAFPNIRIVNQYASAEGAPFITQLPSGKLAVNSDSGVFEFVKPGTDEPAAPGEIAEMLVTSFTTHAFPLIRYRIGDTVVVGENGVCDEWPFPYVDAIYGRRDDLVRSDYRGLVGRLSPALTAGSESIIESQIIQVDGKSFILKVVPGKGYSSKCVEPVVDALKERLGPVDIKVEVVEALKRGANGKVRSVIGLGIGDSAAYRRV